MTTAAIVTPEMLAGLPTPVRRYMKLFRSRGKAAG